MSKDLGWIRLYRSSFNNRLYFSEPFTRWQAWCDLLLLANHKSGRFRVRGILVEVLRGQTGFSSVELSDRWRWSRGKVNRFLVELKNEQQIVQQKSNVTTLISIVNYDKYQTDGTLNGTDNGTLNGHKVVQQTVQQTDINKNDKNNKEDKKEEEVDFVFWESEKKNFINAGDWIFNFCRDKDIKLEKYDKDVKEFLSDLELKEEYKTCKGLKRHFTNWYNKREKGGFYAKKNQDVEKLDTSIPHYMKKLN